MLSSNSLSYKIEGKTIIDEVDFKLNSGEHSLILGPSGCGKTTLLCLLAGLQKPSNGVVKYDDTDIYKLTPQERDFFRGKNLGIIFQNFHLIKSLNVYQNIELAGIMSGHQINQKIIDDYLKQINLFDKRHQKASTLSVGESQRLAIIRSFINKPKWIFCDEPTSALDDDNTEKLLNLLKNEAEKNNSSLIIVTHDNRVKSFFNKNNILELK